MTKTQQFSASGAHDFPQSIQRGKFTLTATIEHDSHHSAPWDEECGHGPVSDWRECDYTGNIPKAPGEVMLCDNDRSGLSGHKSARFYDMAEAVRIARRDKWGSLWPYTLQLSRTRNGSHVATAKAPWTYHGKRADVAERAPRDFSSKPRRDINRAIREIYEMRKAQFPTARAYHANAACADFERLRAWCNDEWSYVGVVVTASRNGINLATASLWGIESDAGEYLAETANDLAEEALTEAREAIAVLAE